MFKVNIFLLLILCFISCKTEKIYNKTLCIKNDKEAILYAESILRKTYGDKINNNKPFTSTLIKDSIWIVRGTLKTQKGGVPYVEINAKNCNTLRISHGK